MSKVVDLIVPNIGDFKNVEIIEVLIKVGNDVEKNDTVITLESDKSSVEVPSNYSGKIKSLNVKIGDKVSEGHIIGKIEVETIEENNKEIKIEETIEENSKKEDEKNLTSLTVPDLSSSKKLILSEILIKFNQKININDTIIVIEDDENSFDIPSPISGIVKKINLKQGNIIESGMEIAKVELESTSYLANQKIYNTKQIKEITASNLYSENTNNPKSASPKVRKFARELGININEINGSARKGRVTEEDIKFYIKSSMNQKNITTLLETKNIETKKTENLPYAHDEFGETDVQKIPRIKRLSGPHLIKAWNEIPHVTQHDEVDVTDMENFRKNLSDLNTKEKISVTPLAFIMKALVNGMRKYPNFNSSLEPTNENIIYKKYFHVGIAVDTPHGLMVPKIRNVDKKDLLSLSNEVRKVSKLCKELKIDKKEFFGGSITISSLGGIGGSFFTPIINSPEVAILGVGKTEMKQVFIGGNFITRAMMPISLSYDHRIIDGAEAARFCQDLKNSLGKNFAFNLSF